MKPLRDFAVGASLATVLCLFVVGAGRLGEWMGSPVAGWIIGITAVVAGLFYTGVRAGMFLQE